MKPQFKDVKFKTMAEAEAWLEEKTALIIHLQDVGFDLLKIWVHATGEILNCNANGEIYCGEFVDLDNLVIGEPLRIDENDGNGFLVFGNLIVDTIDLLKPTTPGLFAEAKELIHQLNHAHEGHPLFDRLQEIVHQLETQSV